MTLKSGELTIAIGDVGAQLASVRKRQEMEFLWQGTPAICPRRAPVLFPIITRLKDQRYTLEGWMVC